MNRNPPPIPTPRLDTESVLHHVPPCPFGAILEAAENGRRAVRRTGPSGYATITKSVKAAMDAAIAEYRSEATADATQNAQRQTGDLRRQTDESVDRNGDLDGRITRLAALLDSSAASTAALHTRASAALAERNTALEQASSVAAESARCRRSLFRRLLHWFIRRTPKRLCLRQIDHLQRAAAAEMESVRLQAGEQAVRVIQDAIAELLAARRQERDAAARLLAEANARQTAGESAFAAGAVVREFPIAAERRDMAREVCLDPARVQMLAQRAMRRYRQGEGTLDAMILDEARREADAAALPAELTDYLRGIARDKRTAHFESLTTEARAALPVKWMEAPLDTRSHWMIPALPGGGGAEFYRELVGANPDRTPVFPVDCSGEDPDHLRVVDIEIGLAPAQIPFLVDARVRCDRSAIEAAMLWDGPGSIDDVEFELQARSSGDEDRAWRRLTLGLVFGLLEIDSGRWCRTTSAAPLNGLSNRRIAQGVEPSVAVLRSTEMAAVLEVAIENRVAALGATEAVAAIEKADNLPIPPEHSERVRHILANERQRLLREVLLA